MMTIVQSFSNPSSRWYYPLRWLVLIFLGLAIYAQTFGYGFVFDDNYFLFNTSFIRSFDGLNQIWPVLPNTRLVGIYSFALNYQISQFDPAGYHIFNFVIHLSAVGLVWALAAKLFKIAGVISQELPFVIAVLFLVHPCQTQAVSYISQRFESMATVFYLGSVYCYLCGRITSLKWHKIFLFACSAVFAILGIFTKEVAATIPMMILAVEFIFLNRDPLNSKKSKSGSSYLRRVEVWKFYLFISVLGFVFILLFMKLVRANFINTYFNFSVPSASHDGDIITGGKYVLTQMRVFLTFLRLLILPINQNLDYDYPLSTGLFNPPLTLAGLALISFMVFLVFRLRKKWPLIAFGMAWILITFSINTAPRMNLIFEHKLYLISFGFFLAIVYFLSALIKDRKILFWFFILLIAVLSLASYKRNQVWKNEATLWQDTVRKSPYKSRPYNGLGIAYGKKGEFIQALLEFNKAIAINPNYAEAYNNRGNVYSKLGKYLQASIDLNKAIAINPNYVDAYTNLGNLYGMQGDFAKALSNSNKAIGINPNNAESYNNRGNAYLKLGNNAQASSDFEKAIALKPNYAEAYNNLAILYLKKGDLAQALSDYNLAIEINPNYSDAYYNRGLIYDKQGDILQAIADYSRAIEISPDYAQAYYSRGILYVKQGNFSNAMLDFNQTLRINPGNAEAYVNRGIIFAQQSDFTQALSDYKMAIEINPNYTSAYVNRGTLYAQQGSESQALSDYNQAIKLNPGFEEAYFNRAIIYCQLKQYDKAWGDVHKAEQLSGSINPDFIKALKHFSP